MSDATGTISFKSGTNYYSAAFPHGGSMAAELIQYLDDVYNSESAEVGLLKLLGFNLKLSEGHPRRDAGEWVEVDLENRVLATNSRLIRCAVNRLTPGPEDTFSEYALRRIYTVLDSLDFKVELYR